MTNSNDLTDVDFDAAGRVTLSIPALWQPASNLPEELPDLVFMARESERSEGGFATNMVATLSTIDPGLTLDTLERLTDHTLLSTLRPF